MKLTQAGQVQIADCIILHNDGAAIDIINQVDSVTIYEDLYSPFITGYISVTDTLDLPGALGRAGRDLLKLRIFTPSIDAANNIDGIFVIYKMAERSEVKDRMQGYNLYFASVEFTIDMMKTVSKTYSGTPSDIVKTILTTQLGSTKPFNFEQTANTIKYTSNFWSPSKNFTYLSNHALNNRQNPTYMFFENRYGYNFKTLEGIGTEAIIQDFSGNDFVSDTNTTPGATRFGTTKRDPVMDYKSILNLRVDVTYDFLRDFAAGMIKSKMYSHDLVTKRVDIKRTDLTQDNMLRMNMNNFYTDDVIKTSEAVLMNMYRDYDVQDKGDSTDYNWRQKRIMEMSTYRAGIVEIEVYGRTDYTVGKKVNLNLNKMTLIGKGDTPDIYLDNVYSGNYIITAIVHHINRQTHTCNIELAKSHTSIKI